MRTRIVIPDDFPPAYMGHPELARLKTLGDVAIYDAKAANADELAARLKNADVVVNVRAYSRFDRDLLGRLPDLKLISILGTGTDNVDLEAATDLGVVVANTPGASTASVAELNFALILAVARAVALSDRKVREGVWHHQHGMELHGKTIGIVGLGLIGAEVARFAQAFGMNVVAWSFSRDPARADRLGVRLVDLDDLFRISDVVSIHLRNSPEAAGLVGPRQIDLMKPGSILVNTARAAIVDEDALLAALRDGRLAGAGLDVFSREPLPPDNPWVQLDNVVLTSHVGWVTHDSSERMMKMPVDNIVAFLEGNPANVVNPGALDRRR